MMAGALPNTAGGRLGVPLLALVLLLLGVALTAAGRRATECRGAGWG